MHGFAFCSYLPGRESQLTTLPLPDAPRLSAQHLLLSSVPGRGSGKDTPALWPRSLGIVVAFLHGASGVVVCSAGTLVMGASHPSLIQALSAYLVNLHLRGQRVCCGWRGRPWEREIDLKQQSYDVAPESGGLLGGSSGLGQFG